MVLRGIGGYSIIGLIKALYRCNFVFSEQPENLRHLLSCKFANLALSRACGAIPLHVMDRPRSLPFWVNGMSMLLIVIGRGVSLAADIICNLVLLVLIFQLFSNWLIDEMALWVWRVIIIFDLLG